jgi:hypothetical protein
MAGGRVFKIRFALVLPPGKPSTRIALASARHVEEIFVGPPIEIACLGKLFSPAIYRQWLFA